MILGAVLAGGRSVRFGADKALADLKGRPMIAHVIEALAPHVEQVLICGRTFSGFRHVDDRPTADLGPLGGLNAALHHAQDFGFARVLALPCDTPLLDPALLSALAGHDGSIVLRDSPVIGIWPAALAARLDDYLAAGGRSMRGWTRHVDARALAFPAPANVNHRQDLSLLSGHPTTAQHLDEHADVHSV